MFCLLFFKENNCHYFDKTEPLIVVLMSNGNLPNSEFTGLSLSTASLVSLYFMKCSVSASVLCPCVALAGAGAVWGSQCLGLAELTSPERESDTDRMWPRKVKYDKSYTYRTCSTNHAKFWCCLQGRRLSLQWVHLTKYCQALVQVLSQNGVRQSLAII